MKLVKRLPLVLSVLLLAGCGSTVNYFSVGEYTKNVIIAMFGENPDPEEVKLYFNDDFSELIDYPAIQEGAAIQTVQDYKMKGTDRTVEELLTEVSNEIFWFAIAAKNVPKAMDHFEVKPKLKDTDIVVQVRNDFRITIDYPEGSYSPKSHIPLEFYFHFIVSEDGTVELFEPDNPYYGKERYMTLYESVKNPEPLDSGYLTHYLHELFHF